MSLRASVVAAAVMTLTGVASSDAATIGYDILFDPADVLIVNNGGDCLGTVTPSTVTGLEHGGCSSLTFTYTLSGFDPLTDTLSSGVLSLSLYDDNDPGPDEDGNHEEAVNITLDGTLLSGSPVLITNGSTAGDPFSPSYTVVAALSDGTLTVLLTLPDGGLGNNDFFFASSRLVVAGERSEESAEETPSGTQIPEPGAFALLTTAMGAFILRRRGALLR